MHAFLTVRRVKAGSYEDWRRAWEPDQWPEGARKAYILRNVDDPDEVIAFGFFDSDVDSLRDDPALRESQRAPSSGWHRTSSRRGRMGSTRW